MQNRLLVLFISLTFVVLFVSCNDDPTSLGSDLIPNQDFINATKVNSVDLNFEQKSKYHNTDSLSLTSASKIFLGKSGNVQSTMLMKFFMFFPDSIQNAILGDSLNLLSSVVEMEPFYVYGDKENSFDFTVHKINSDWNSLDFGETDLEALDFDITDLKSNYKNEGDSLITFDIDKDVVQNWMELAANSQQENNYGVYFNLKEGSNKILGFPSISTLYDSVLTRLKLIVEVPNNYTDTLTVQVTADVHVVSGDLPNTVKDNIFVQGGIPVRSDIFIDVSQIPQDAIINQATLMLYVDDDESEIGTIETTLLRLALLSDYELSEINTSYAGINMEMDSSDNYTADITNYVQEWISNENNGMKLFIYDEAETINKVAIYSNKNTNLALRPYLEIIYTIKN